eukprot:CAMPEP_0196810472 /NCGR_PEP_ID=MMETSP1362-20130617/10289_1 /TAXON_ID=163516 /ORGANISM="Leptocylindrus danicus, Strain CCMP1856" /LENGTH=369 /DNA_ID=CAMNT_0042185479 /DNA_START=79 /DNA_END=1188 /DNA_ORIENTATION=-
MSITHTASESSSPIIILIIGYLIGCSTNETTLADRINAFMPYWTIACLLAIAGMGYTELLAQKKHSVVPSRKSSRSINRNSNSSMSMRSSMRTSMNTSASVSVRTLGTACASAYSNTEQGVSTRTLHTKAEEPAIAAAATLTLSSKTTITPIPENINKIATPANEVVHEFEQTKTGTALEEANEDGEAPATTTTTTTTTSESSPKAKAASNASTTTTVSVSKPKFVNLSGSYVLNRHENFETLLIAMGAPWAGRKLILGQKPNQKITMDEEKIHLWSDGLMPIDQEYVFGADPVETKAKKGANMDRVTILENGAVRLTRVNDVMGVTTTVDRELIEHDGGKVLRLSTRAEFRKKGMEPIEVKHFFDPKE